MLAIDAVRANSNMVSPPAFCRAEGHVPPNRTGKQVPPTRPHGQRLCVPHEQGQGIL